MAESWAEYFGGTPERRARYMDEQRKKAAEVQSSPMYRAMGRMTDHSVDVGGGMVDPRESRMAMMQDHLLAPRSESEYANAAGAVVDYGLDFGGRMRDTAFTSAAEYGKGNYGKGLELAARAPVAGLYPPAGAGMRGQPDDWRAIAEKNGVSPQHILATDLLTDPENWVTAPVKGPMALVAPGILMRTGSSLSKLSRADDILRTLGRAGDSVRYGASVPIVDEAGDAIRKLRAAQ